jgi:hypothetical protein
MEIALVLTTIVSLVVGVLLGRNSYARRSPKYTHSSARIVYWIENDMVVFADPNTGKFHHSANISAIEEYFFKRPLIFWNGESGDDSVSIIVDWSEPK